MEILQVIVAQVSSNHDRMSHKAEELFKLLSQNLSVWNLLPMNNVKILTKAKFCHEQCPYFLSPFLESLLPPLEN